MAEHGISADSVADRPSTASAQMFRLLPLFFCLLALSASGAEEVAASVWQWHEANGEDGREILPVPGVKLAPAARGAFVERRMHEVGGKRFRALY
jgi:hypothetical protein